MPNPESQSKPEKGSPRKHIPLTDWESAVEKSIRQAMERGDFDNLPGQGKPLDLHRNPNTPAEWEMAFRLLQDAGYAPAWIELGKELRTARDALFAPLNNYLHRLADSRGGTANDRYAAQLIAEFRERAAELNRQIDTFNLQAPSPRVHQARIQIDEEIERFRRNIRNGRPAPEG